MLGWGYLGGELHYWGGEEAALTATRAFIQRVSGTVCMTYGCDVYVLMIIQCQRALFYVRVSSNGGWGRGEGRQGGVSFHKSPVSP